MSRERGGTRNTILCSDVIFEVLCIHYVDLLVRYHPTEMSAISVIVTSVVHQEMKCRRAILWLHNENASRLGYNMSAVITCTWHLMTIRK